MAPPRRVIGDQAFDNWEPRAPKQQIPDLPRAPRSGRFRPTSGGGGVDQAIVFDEHHYARLNGSLTVNIPAGTSVLALAGPSSLRNLLQFRNPGATDPIYIDFGGSADANSILSLAAGDQVLYDTVVPQDDVYAFATVDSVLIIAYSTIPGQQI